MILVLLLLSLGLSRATPTFLIDAPKSHCVELVTPRDEVIEIAYTAPGKFLRERHSCLDEYFVLLSILRMIHLCRFAARR